MNRVSANDSHETGRKEPQLCLSHWNLEVAHYCTQLAQSHWWISHIYFETVSYWCTFSLVNSRLTKPFEVYFEESFFDSTSSKRICGSLQGCTVKKNVKWFSLQIFCSGFLYLCSPKTLTCSFFFFGIVFESLCCIRETNEILLSQLYFNNLFLNERKKWEMIVGGGHQEDVYVGWPVNQIWALELFKPFLVFRIYAWPIILTVKAVPRMCSFERGRCCWDHLDRICDWTQSKISMHINF